VNDETRRWLEIADEDFAAAEDMLATGHLGHLAVACQQSLEKTLKAILVEESSELPLRTHDLPRLADEGDVEVDEETERLLRQLTNLYFAVRYPDMDRPADLTEEAARELLDRTREVREWLLTRLD